MGLFDRFSPKNNFDETGWKILSSEEQLDDLISRSSEKPMLIFKDSTTCGISASVKDKLLNSWDMDPDKVEFYYLDLLTYRPVSNKIASVLGVPHQSPQVILVKDGSAIFNRSHFSITPESVRQAIEETNA